MSSLRSPKINESFSNASEMTHLMKTIQAGDERILNDFVSIYTAIHENQLISAEVRAMMNHYHEAVTNYQPREYKIFIPQAVSDTLGVTSTGMRILGKLKPEYILAGIYQITIQDTEQTIIPTSAQAIEGGIEVKGRLVPPAWTDPKFALLLDTQYRMSHLKFSCVQEAVRTILADKAIAALPDKVKDAIYPEYQEYHAQRRQLFAEQKHFSQSGKTPFFHTADIAPFIHQILNALYPQQAYTFKMHKVAQKAWISGMSQEQLDGVAAFLKAKGIASEDLTLGINKKPKATLDNTPGQVEETQPEDSSAKAKEESAILLLEKLNYSTLKKIAADIAEMRPPIISIQLGVTVDDVEGSGPKVQRK